MLGPNLPVSDVASRRGIECGPTVAGKVGFHPGVRILRTDHVVAGDIVELIAAEAIHHPRWNVQRAQHHCHRGRKVFAMPLLANEKEIRQGSATGVLSNCSVYP